MKKAGLIGLGAMGSPMAKVTAEAGFAVRAYDINPASVEALGDGVGVDVEGLRGGLQGTAELEVGRDRVMELPGARTERLVEP